MLSGARGGGAGVTSAAGRGASWYGDSLGRTPGDTLARGALRRAGEGARAAALEGGGGFAAGTELAPATLPGLLALGHAGRGGARTSSGGVDVAAGSR